MMKACFISMQHPCTASPATRTNAGFDLKKKKKKAVFETEGVCGQLHCSVGAAGAGVQSKGRLGGAGLGLFWGRRPTSSDMMGESQPQL